MVDTLRILILEDNPADAELVQFELRETGLDFTAKVVTNKKNFLRELEEYCPDLILSDYDLPQYDGASALAETQKRCSEVPFILVTGAISEERAIEILTGGAKDYVMKTRLSRLGPAVQRALAEAKEHRARKLAEEELRAASFYSRSLIEASLDPLVTISPDGKVTDVNKATEEFTGVSREEIIGNDFSDYFTEPEKARAGYERAFRDGSVRDYPLAVRHASGHITEVLYNATTYRNERGEVQGVFAAARDVTELKKAEEELRRAHANLQEEVEKRTEELRAEISEHEMTERALQESRENYRELVKTANIIILRMDRHGRITFFNDYAQEFFGYTLDEILGKDVKILVPRIESNGQNLEDMVHRILDDPDHYSENVNQNTKKNGEIVWISWRNRGMLDAQGNLIGNLAIGIDVTERRRMEEEIRTSHTKYRIVADNAYGFEFWVDPQGRFVHASPSCKRITGYAPEEFMEDPGLRRRTVHPEDLHLYDLHIEDEKNRRGVPEREWRILRADGLVCWISHNCQPIFSDTGEYWGVRGTNRDVSSRKWAEQASRDWEQELTAIYDNAPLVILLVDGERRISKANKFAETLAASSTAELIGRRAGEALRCRHASDDPRGCGFGRACGECVVYRAITETFETGCGCRQREVDLHLSAGDSLIQEITGLLSTVRIDVGDEPQVLVTIQDITERKEAEKKLESHAAQLEAANKELESFSYSVSHDLRAPLRAIDGYTRMIARSQGDRFDEETKVKFNQIRKGVRTMNQLIEELLNFSRMSRAHLSLARLAMDDLVAEAWKEQQGANPDRRMSLTVNTIPPAMGDRTLIRQVISNLLSNAVKFTRGREEVLIEVTGNENETETTYCVRDNGIGFDMKYSDKLFGVFQRLHGAENFEGTGVGLAIVERIIHRHGGRVWAEGEVDKGAAFSFTLPAVKS